MGLDGCKKKEPQTAQQVQQAQAQAPPAATYAVPTPDQLYQLVAPIALFPDNLVAIVLASSTFPTRSPRPGSGCSRTGGSRASS